MGVSVTFYSNFNKRGNSTKQPAGGTTLNCELRDGGSSVLNPNLEVRGVSAFAYNYMYIPDFRRYYYIDTFQWNAEEGYWLISGNSDPLASAKEQIVASSQFVMRADTLSQNDITVIDGLALPRSRVTSRYTYDIVGGDYPFPPVASGFGAQTVIVNVAGEGYFCLSGSQYNLMVASFFGYADPQGTQWITQDIARQIVNPSSHFMSQTAFPFSFSVIKDDIGGTAINPKVAFWQLTNVTAYYVNRTWKEYGGTVQVGYHPQSNNDNTHYLNNPPYVNYSLYIGGLGLIGLDNSKIQAGETLYIRLNIDFAGGGARVKVINSSGQIVGYATGECGYNVAMISRKSADAIGVVQNTLVGGIVGGVAGALMAGATSAISQIGGSGSAIVHGSTGGCGGWQDFSSSRMQAEYKSVINPNINKEGYPVCKTLTLSALVGYVQCRNASVQTHLTREETIQIENALNGGVYIE